MAYATMFLHFAAWAYTGDFPEEGKSYLQHALSIDPTLAAENINFLVRKMVDQIGGLSLSDSNDILGQTIANLPGDAGFKNKLGSLLWRRYFEVAAFQAYASHQRAKCFEYVIRSASKTPSCLQNRGIISILVWSLTGRKMSDIHRRPSPTDQRIHAE